MSILNIPNIAGAFIAAAACDYIDKNRFSNSSEEDILQITDWKNGLKNETDQIISKAETGGGDNLLEQMGDTHKYIISDYLTETEASRSEVKNNALESVSSIIYSAAFHDNFNNEEVICELSKQFYKSIRDVNKTPILLTLKELTDFTNGRLDPIRDRKNSYNY